MRCLHATSLSSCQTDACVYTPDARSCMSSVSIKPMLGAVARMGFGSGFGAKQIYFKNEIIPANRAADRNTALCPMMSQITNRADIWLKTNKSAPTWWMAAWSLFNLLESHLRSSPLFSQQSVANLSSQRHLPAAPLHRGWPFPLCRLLVLTCWISSWLMSPTPLVVSHQTVPVCSYSPTVEVMSNIVFWSQSLEKWSAFACVRGVIFVLKW